jgi:K+-transporting ATPase ATPase C chain
MNLLRPALTLLALFTVLTGLIYPAVVTGLAQVFFPHQANGSLIVVGEIIVGSELIGQAFNEEHYVHGRPSATEPAPYNAAASTGSNLGPLNPALHENVTERVRVLRDSLAVENQIPIDLVTASGSGLDPHVSPAAALCQAGRVARARGIPEERVRALIEKHIEGRTLGILGEPRVNVLRLNLELDQIAPVAEMD